ncbi:PEP/pyruvate-binding domain-containing protein [Streptomyces sp. DSM 44915]|uniref:PEP/pyruvate-binding domain-containing protein n=1 Tax=Streptomyces chisholmiae TaxID=3075540 RepID=A0ABU2JP48_9ACTN|nr:PEP/pyruvate-binding domain-containing protein [Streptomyces sp. DSM 44915]MDT0266770.1 PEP/pyruvate-binding domain-containing protein [Streptomyces sp. DSM 44915]
MQNQQKIVNILLMKGVAVPNGEGRPALVPLRAAEAETCGGKAGALGGLLRAGLPVPDGFVLPFDAYRAAVRGAAERPPATPPFPAWLRAPLGRALAGLGERPLAVRSSAAHEDGAGASAAGQHESVLAVRGAADVIDAIRVCWTSLHTPRALAYRGRRVAEPLMAVLVHRLVDAEVSGVLFTGAGPRDEVRIEAARGLGTGVVGGTVTPDAYRVGADGSVSRVPGVQPTRLDRDGDRLVSRPVPAADLGRPVLDDAIAGRLARLGRAVTERLGGARDIEWAVADGRPWVLQARPVTVRPPAPPPARGHPAPGTLTGTPGSRGTATGVARVLRTPTDLGRVRPGCILVCPHTDPSWTVLLRAVAGVVTEVGGVLSHAAIVAREQGVPAVLGVPDATSLIRDGSRISIDGTTGAITTVSP